LISSNRLNFYLKKGTKKADAFSFENTSAHFIENPYSAVYEGSILSRLPKKPNVISDFEV